MCAVVYVGTAISLGCCLCTWSLVKNNIKISHIVCARCVEAG